MLVVSVQEPRGQYRYLLVADFRRTILLLWLLWFAVACVYYGIVLSQSEILERGGVCAGKNCFIVYMLFQNFVVLIYECMSKMLPA